MNKRAMELSINFVVVMILSIAILSASFILVKQFFGKAGEVKAKLDSETESDIRSLLVSGERVAIPLHSRKVITGKPVILGVGISNILREGAEDYNTFEISVKDGEDECDCVNEDIVGEVEPLDVNYIPTIEIDKNNQNIVLIAVDTSKGQQGATYECDIKVMYHAEDGTKPIYADSSYKASIEVESGSAPEEKTDDREKGDDG